MRTKDFTIQHDNYFESKPVNFVFEHHSQVYTARVRLSILQCLELDMLDELIVQMFHNQFVLLTWQVSAVDNEFELILNLKLYFQ